MSTQQQNTFKKWENSLNGHFLKQNIKMDSKYIENASITNHWGNANKNHRETLLYSCIKGCYHYY